MLPHYREAWATVQTSIWTRIDNHTRRRYKQRKLLSLCSIELCSNNSNTSIRHPERPSPHIGAVQHRLCLMHLSDLRNRLSGMFLTLGLRVGGYSYPLYTATNDHQNNRINMCPGLLQCPSNLGTALAPRPWTEHWALHQILLPRAYLMQRLPILPGIRLVRVRPPTSKSSSQLASIRMTNSSCSNFSR